MTAFPVEEQRGRWLQTERAAHEAWGRLIDKSPKAAKLMHLLTARIGKHNAVVVSLPTLASIMDCSRPTVVRAVKLLKDDNWIEVRQIGGSGTSNAYIVNDRVAWLGKRDGIRYSLFSAQVIVSDHEQPDQEKLGQQAPLRQIPALNHGEGQLPHGPGLPPPSEPFLDGLEPKLPAVSRQAHPENSDPDTWDYEDSPTLDGPSIDEAELEEWRQFKRWKEAKMKQNP